MDKTFFLAKLNQETPLSVIHGWKATDLLFMMVKRKKYFFHPVKRQIFGDASGKTSALILTVCHIRYGIAQLNIFVSTQILSSTHTQYGVQVR